MKIQGVKGTRDLYPEDMLIRNWLTDAWRRVSVRNGFHEYDGPIFEHLELYTAKSGDEIVAQLFHLKDRGGRELAIRPEMTPTLARMINARAPSLPRPIKWFSIGPFCRAERPQRGRLREFLQWNVDVVGTDDVLADAESIFVAVDFLREIGLTPQDVTVRINSRALMSAMFAELGIPDERHERAYLLWDKAGKLPRAELAAAWDEELGDRVEFREAERLVGVRSLDGVRAAASERGWCSRGMEEGIARVREALGIIHDLGITEFCYFDTSVVRGLAYYTGIVYEVFDRDDELRAVAGGGRYDDLLKIVGGTRMSGVGFGMGDVVVVELLRRAGRLPAAEPGLDFFVAEADSGVRSRVLGLVGGLRRAGYRVDFSYRRQPLGRQLKLAAERGAARSVIVGAETREEGEVTIKDMASGKQVRRRWQDFLDDPRG